MAKSPEANLTSLAKKFDEAFREHVRPLQSEGTITVMQYARGAKISRYAARDRLVKMVSAGTATREKFRHGFVYRLS